MPVEIWIKVASAITLGAMILFLLPRAKQLINESAEAKPGEWRSTLLPLAVVVLFVVFLLSVTKK